MELSGVTRAHHELIFDLYRPAGTPRLRLIAAGRYADGWLAPRGAITVWSARGGTLTLDLSLPGKTQVTPMTFTAVGVRRTIRVRPAARVRLTFRVPARSPWSLHYSTTRPGYLSNERAVSVVARSLSFSKR